MPFFVLYSKNHQSSPICTPTRSFVRSVVVSTTKVFARERSIYNIRIGYHPRESRAPKAPTRAHKRMHARTAQVSAYEARCKYVCVRPLRGPEPKTRAALFIRVRAESCSTPFTCHICLFTYCKCTHARRAPQAPRARLNSSTAYASSIFALASGPQSVYMCECLQARGRERESVCLCVCLCWPGRLPQHGRCAGECVRALGV